MVTQKGGLRVRGSLEPNMATGSRHILLTCLSSPPLPHPDIPGSSPETLPLSTKRFERFVCAGCETATEPGRVTDPVSEDVCF